MMYVRGGCGKSRRSRSRIILQRVWHSQFDISFSGEELIFLNKFRYLGAIHRADDGRKAAVASRVIQGRR